MLIRFNVRNFLPFCEHSEGRSEEFSMIAGKVRKKKEHVFNDGKIKILKFAAIYGANASGKSSLVQAIDFMRQTIVDRLPDGYSEMYCKTDLKNGDKPTYFETEILLNGKYYSYGFEILLKQGKFLSEWLIELIGDKEKNIFSRDIKNEVFESSLKSGELGKRISIYAEDIKSDDSVLFLHMMNRNKKDFYEKEPSARILQDIFLWFQETLTIIFPGDIATNYINAFQTNRISNVAQLLNAFGTGIMKCKLADIKDNNELEKILAKTPENFGKMFKKTLEETQVKLNREEFKTARLVLRQTEGLFLFTLTRNNPLSCQKVQFTHNNNEIPFNLREESDGTVRLIDLMEILLNNQQKVYVVDELDRCLHPMLSYKFVQTYLEMAKERNCQFIVTTHESRLIDLNLLRRDEIWFVNKNTEGQANIYSLEEYNTRFDEKADKAYLEGRYGGIPIFGKISPLKED